MKEFNKVLDGGQRTQFAGGGVREIDPTKGRCDLIYNSFFTDITHDFIFNFIEQFVRTGDKFYLIKATSQIIDTFYDCWQDAYLDLSKHYANGANKYAERNMEKGLPFHSMVDSALRHYVKALRGDEDENHKAAVIWNLTTLMYMVENKPEMNDLPYKNTLKPKHISLDVAG